jgi:ribonuclease Z
LKPIVNGADVLVIEATFLKEDAVMAKDYGHLTAHEAAEFASECSVRHLVLNHISGRYSTERILREASAAFPDVRVAADLDRISV